MSETPEFWNPEINTDCENTVVGQYDDETKSFWYEATLRDDGCVHYRRYFNFPEFIDRRESDEHQSSNYMHICSLKDVINQLLELRKIGKEKFGERWDE